MGIINKAHELGKTEANKGDTAKADFAAKIQAEVIEPLCRKFDIAFIVHPQYDEATFLSKEIKSGDSNFEGVWYRPSWGGASDTMKNAKDQEMGDAIKACWELIRTHGLVSSKKNYVQSFENGIDSGLKEKVLYRLGYLACCP